MKKIKYIIVIVVAFVFTTSCEESIDTWSGKDRLNFVTMVATDTVKNYSFVFQQKDVIYDTVWLDVETQGSLFDYSREVKLKAVEPYGGVKAVAGVHYVDFESNQISENLKSKYVIPAGENKTQLPIVLIRDETLQQYAVTLRIVFEENEYFEPGFSGNWAHRSIIITDMLSKPQIWDSGPASYFGTYGAAKHKFMIEMSGQAFDNEWMDANFYYYEMIYGGVTYSGFDANDSDYMEYLAAWFQRKLDEENASTATILKEADGTVVSFQ